MEVDGRLEDITFPTLHLGWIFGKVPAKVKVSGASTFFVGGFHQGRYLREDGR